MHDATISRYAAQADARERDPIVTPGEHGRADVANGKRGRWGRYNDPASLVWVTTLEGKNVGLTRNQANIYGEARRLDCTGIRVTMRALAVELGVAASTVYRALVRLEALGLIAYQSNRGRLGGVVFLLRKAYDGLAWRQDEARATLKRWYKASEDRISRLRTNVASLYPTTTIRLTEYTDTDIVIGRNIYAEWSPEDFREAGLM